MPETTHEGNDPMGALTTHRGPLDTCPAPECQDRIIEQQDETPAGQRQLNACGFRDGRRPVDRPARHRLPRRPQPAADRQPDARAPRCSCGGQFPLHHLNADTHDPITPAQEA